MDRFSNTAARVAIAKRWARVFPGKPMPEFGSLPSMHQAITLEQQDPQLFAVISGAPLPVETSIQLMEGTWPAEPDPATTGAALQAEAEQRYQQQLQAMTEELEQLQQARRAGPDAATRHQEHQMLEQSRRQGQSFAQRENAATFRRVMGIG